MATTDLSSDSDGYAYTGYGEVGDNLTPAPVPATVASRLVPIRRAHQSLPAPTLVNGRPT